jgi:hypothetical protein
MEARYCARCGYDTQGSLPARQQTNLPAVIGKAAVPVLVGAASLAVSAGFKLLQGIMARQAQAQQPQPPARATGAGSELTSPRRVTITVRTSWAVGDSSGRWEKGQAEQKIELGE